MLKILLLLIILYIIFVKYNCNNIIKSIIIGLLFGVLAYNFIPFSDYDLYRHHQFVKGFIYNPSINYLITKIHLHEFELLPTIYSFLIAKTGNINLTQFFMVGSGYGIMYYLVSDYAKKIKLKWIYYILVMFFAIFGFYVLYFISGLYYYFAVILFALAFYLDYNKENSNKLIVYLLYIASFFLHDAMFFAIVLLLLFKLFKNKINIKSGLLISLSIYFSYSILSFLSSIDSLVFLKPIYNLYNAYLSNGEYMVRLYRGNIFFLEISKLIVVLILLFLTRKKKEIATTNNYLLLLSFATIFMMMKSIVMIRFCMLIQLIGIIPMINYFKEKNKNNIFMFILIGVLDIYYIIYFYYTLSWQYFAFKF